MVLFLLPELILQTCMRSHHVGARCLIFGWTFRLLPYFMCVNSGGSGETARIHRLAWAFAGHLCDEYHNLMSSLKYSSGCPHDRVVTAANLQCSKSLIISPLWFEPSPCQIWDKPSAACGWSGVFFSFAPLYDWLGSKWNSDTSAPLPPRPLVTSAPSYLGPTTTSAPVWKKSQVRSAPSHLGP